MSHNYPLGILEYPNSGLCLLHWRDQALDVPGPDASRASSDTAVGEVHVVDGIIHFLLV
jgi:hypothetical protein